MKVGALILVVGAGCVPQVEGGLHSLTEAQHPGALVLGDRAIAAGTTLFVSAPGADLAGLELVSDDPFVLEASDAEELDPGASGEVVYDEESDRSWVALRAGEPGFTFLSLVDPGTGAEYDRLEVGVEAWDHVTLNAASHWRVDRVLPLRVAAGLPHSFSKGWVDAAGHELAGVDAEHPTIELPASPPGVVSLEGVEVVVVDPLDVVGLELLPARHRATGGPGLLAVGREASGAEVLGLPVAFTGSTDPAARGDVFAWKPGASAVEIEGSFGGRAATATVFTDEPGVVGWSDRPMGCATVPVQGAGLVGALAVLASLRTRRYALAA